MEQNLVEATALAGSVENVNLSVWALYLQATWIVKIVLIALILASIWTWAIIIDKVRRLRHLDRAATAFEDEFWSGGTLDGLYEKVGKRPSDPMTAVFTAAMREWHRTASRGIERSQLSLASVQQRIDRVMQVSLGRETVSYTHLTLPTSDLV